MNRQKPQKSTPLILQKSLKLPVVQKVSSIPQNNIKQLMVAQILAGMMANPRKGRFDHYTLTQQAVECVERIIDLTQ